MAAVIYKALVTARQDASDGSGAYQQRSAPSQVTGPQSQPPAAPTKLSYGGGSNSLAPACARSNGMLYGSPHYFLTAPNSCHPDVQNKLVVRWRRRDPQLAVNGNIQGQIEAITPRQRVFPVHVGSTTSQPRIVFRRRLLLSYSAVTGPCLLHSALFRQQSEVRGVSNGGILAVNSYDSLSRTTLTSFSSQDAHVTVVRISIFGNDFAPAMPLAHPRNTSCIHDTCHLSTCPCLWPTHPKTLPACLCLWPTFQDVLQQDFTHASPRPVAESLGNGPQYVTVDTQCERLRVGSSAPFSRSSPRRLFETTVRIRPLQLSREPSRHRSTPIISLL